MLNVLGEAEGNTGLMIAQSLLQKALKVPGAKVHWYEKSNVQKDRKVQSWCLQTRPHDCFI